jgi:cytochrome P450
VYNTQGIVVRDPEAMKRIFQTGYKHYQKDLKLSYHPFLPILGTGLVTSDGDLWQKQRTLMGPALRVEVLDDIIMIAHEATARLCVKLQQYVGTRKTVNIEEEFRFLTLQVQTHTHGVHCPHCLACTVFSL